MTQITTNKITNRNVRCIEKSVLSFQQNFHKQHISKLNCNSIRISTSRKFGQLLTLWPFQAFRVVQVLPLHFTDFVITCFISKPSSFIVTSLGHVLSTRSFRSMYERSTRPPHNYVSNVVLTVQFLNTDFMMSTPVSKEYHISHGLETPTINSHTNR